MGEITSGIIIFIDIDNYLRYASELKVAEECTFIFPIYRNITQIAKRYDMVLARTFGDAFLLFKTGLLNCDILNLSINFIDDIKSTFTQSNMTFKAALIAGIFFHGCRKIENNLNEIILCGSTVNLAGKMVSECDADQLIICWPKDTESYPTDFKSIKSNKHYNNMRLSISKTELREALTSQIYNQFLPEVLNNE